MVIKPLGFGLLGAAILALIIGLFITPHEAGAPHVIGFYVLLSAGAIVLAMGSKARVSKKTSLNPAPEPSAAEAPDASNSLPKAMIVAGAATAAAATAGLVASRDERPASGDDRLLEDLERDLFSDLASGKPLDTPAVVSDADLPKVEATSLLPEAQDLVSSQDIASSPVVPEAIGLSEAAQPVNGLLADDDLAALQAGEDPLPPLEGLDIVGAYDSGGTRFTMYSDGSVTAFGPDLDRRFKSLDALRAYIDKGK